MNFFINNNMQRRHMMSNSLIIDQSKSFVHLIQYMTLLTTNNRQITEFVEKYIDRNKIFDREIRGKLDDFYAAMNWDKLPENNNMNKFFSFG